MPRIMELHIHLDGAWRRCASVVLADETQGSRRDPVRLQYDADYAIEHLGADIARLARELSTVEVQ